MSEIQALHSRQKEEIDGLFTKLGKVNDTQAETAENGAFRASDNLCRRFLRPQSSLPSSPWLAGGGDPPRANRPEPARHTVAGVRFSQVSGLVIQRSFRKTFSGYGKSTHSNFFFSR